MKWLGTIGLVLSSFSVWASPPTLSRNASGEIEVELGAEVNAALAAFDSEFRMFTAAEFSPHVRAADPHSAMVVIGDFNGDGTNDAAVMGLSANRLIVNVALSEGTEYQVQTLKPDSIKVTAAGVNGRLMLIDREVAHTKPEFATTKHFAHDAFAVGDGAGVPEIYYVEGERLISYKP